MNKEPESTINRDWYDNQEIIGVCRDYAKSYTERNMGRCRILEDKIVDLISQAKKQGREEAGKAVIKCIKSSSGIKDLFEKGTRYLALADVLELLDKLTNKDSSSAFKGEPTDDSKPLFNLKHSEAFKSNKDNE